MLIGYMRPCHNDRNCEIQSKELTQLNCDKMIREEHSSAKKRIQLKSMIDHVNQGDKIVVTQLLILADSTRHLGELLEILQTKGANVHFLLEEIDTSKKYHFNDIVKHMVEFQSDVISESTKKGLKNAKQLGRPRKPDENVKRAIQMYQSKKYSLTEITNETGISKSTLYRYLES